MNPDRVRCGVAVVASLLFFSSTADSHACACCSDPGEYRFTTDDPVEEYERDQVRGMTFAEKAILYQTDAGEEENEKGIDGISPTSKVSATIAPREWRLFARTKGRPAR